MRNNTQNNIKKYKSTEHTKQKKIQNIEHTYKKYYKTPVQ